MTVLPSLLLLLLLLNLVISQRWSLVRFYQKPAFDHDVVDIVVVMVYFKLRSVVTSEC